MTKKIRILFLSANPWTTSRILVDEEAREIFEKLQEGPNRDTFELHRHAAIRPRDLQRLLMMYEPHIVHFSGHGSKKQKIILAGTPGRGKQVDRHGLVQVFALYKNRVRLVVLNACFTRPQARSLSEVIDYSVGAGKGIGDKEGVAFAGAFYRALGFGKSVKAAFESAKAELALTRMPRTKGLDLFVRNGVNENDSFPRIDRNLNSEADTGKDVSARGQVSSMRTETGAAELGLMRLGDKLSRSFLASLRKVKRANRTKPNPLKDEIELRSSMSYSRAYVVVTIKIDKLSWATPQASHKGRSARKDQASRTRRGLANKRLDREKRAESGRSG